MNTIAMNSVHNHHFDTTCHLIKHQKDRMEQSEAASAVDLCYKKQASQQGQVSPRFWAKLKKHTTGSKKSTEVESEEDREAKKQIWWRQLLIANSTHNVRTRCGLRM
ncbi:hypothetical protein PINS_up004790 [Pythium insidiosum]|nr:hypothetical protein PINS_up004790 [Pythium insidiosum]